MKTNVFILLIALLFTTYSKAEIIISSSPDSEVRVCDEAASFQVTCINNEASTLTAVQVKIALPQGITYEAGSITELTSYGVSEFNVSQDTALTFSANNLAVGDSITFSIQYKATKDAIDFQNAGGVFRNNVTLSHSSGSATEESDSYNILYPEISILNVSPSSTSITSGNSTTRSILVINGGNGRTNRIVISDVRNSGLLTLDGTSMGTLAGDSIILEGADFNSIGNGDNYLDQNESFTLTQTLSGTSCADITVTSTIKAWWGCSGDQTASSNSYANVTINFNNPNVKLIASESLDACFGAGEASQQELKIVNSGSGISTSGIVKIYKSTGGAYNQDIFSRFDENSFTLKIGANGTPSSISFISTEATTNSGDYACLGPSPIGKVVFEIPDLQPGDTAIVNWDMYSCCIQTCQDDAVKGWRAEIDYSDICNAQTFSKTLTGQNENEQYMSFFTESPIDIEDGQQKEFSFIVSSFKNTLPVGDVAAYKADFTLDAGLQYASLKFHSNGIEWTPYNVVYNPSTNVVTAMFPEDAPFTVPKSVLDLTLEGTCGNSGWKTIEMDFSYVPDTTCTTACAIPLACNVQTTTYLFCPIGTCNSLQVLDFSVERVNFGAPDNNLDGIADASGSLDMTEVKANRAMVGDTVRSTTKAVIGVTTDTWEYAGFTSSIDYGNVLTVVDITAAIYDASSSTSYVVNGLSANNTVNGNEQEFDVNLAVSELISLNSAMVGYTYASGDSITLTINYRVTSSVAGLIKEATFLNEFYLSQVSSPSSGQKEFCNFKNGRFTFIGYSWRNNNSNNLTIKSCSGTNNQYFGMSIGDVGSNYGGGNLFPFEYRHWGQLKEAWAIIPPNYTLMNTTIRQYRTRRTNSHTTESLYNITPDAINGDTLYFNMEQYYASGQWKPSDDGFHGRFWIELAPNCDVPENTYQNIDWIFNYQKSAAIDGAETGGVTASSPDKVRFQRPTLELSSNDPWQDANQRQVVWDYKVKNSSGSGAQNAWMHIVAPNNIIIDSVVIDNSGVALTKVNDIYLIGTINSNSTADLSVYGTFSNCDSVLISTYAGYECTGYPTDFSSFTCPYEFMPLYVEPKQSAYQTRISTNLMEDPCDPQIELTLDITSTKIAHMFDMQIDLITPDTTKIKVVDGTSEFQYNISNAYASISDPDFSSGTYSYVIEDYNSDFELGGIPGVMDISNNRYRLKLILELGPSFVQGEFLQIQVNGANACAVQLPTVNLAYDPNISFAKDNTAGLHLDIKNSWSASWGDYDNDGYDDLFVPSRDYNQTSILYHNNQDGTFTSVTAGSIVTDLGTSISGTWGDYDNDGDLDLFVANSENSSNRLYSNNGDGTFTSVLSGNIITEGVYSHSAAWADYNKDGNLDIVVSDYHPTNFNRLFYGDGNGGFNVDEASVISQSATTAVGVAWGDFDNDRDPDLFIANTNGENNQLFRNDAGVFTEITTGSIVSDGGTSVGGAWGDYDNDGDLDLFVTNSSDQDPNFFYENNGDGTFTRIMSGAIVSNVSNSHGASWIDYDNDGDLDLIVANDQNKHNFLFANNGDKTFSKLDNAITNETGNSYGTAWSDFDNDGDYDLFVTNTDANANDFFVNEKGSCTNHVVVKLQGCNSNSQGVGAMIRVKSTIYGQTFWQTKHVSTQTSAMGGQNSSKILFGLGDATTVDSMIVLWPSGMETILVSPAVNQLHVINEDCGSQVCGTVYYDANDNGVQDGSEIGIANQKVIVSPGGIHAFTDNTGSFNLYLADGDYDIILDTNENWNLTNPVGGYSITVDQSISSVYCGNDFANLPVCLDPDFEVSVGATAFRKGLQNDLNIALSNRGAVDATGMIDLELTTTDNVFVLDEGWELTSATGGYNVFNYSLSGLSALSDTVITIVDSVSNASALEDLVTIELRVSYALGECDTLNNTSSLTDKVVGSLDPNDKLVFVDKVGASEYCAREDKLIYKIRFQNVGTYSAQRVFIVDTLDENLDSETFEVMSSSHYFIVTRNGNVITWLNNKIELPDSSTNLEASNGYVMFSIYPKRDLAPFELIQNTAGIQFDYNDYVITNTVENVVLSDGATVGEGKLFIYPNPSTDWIHVRSVDHEGRLQEMDELRIISGLGQTVLEEHPQHYESQIDINGLAKGVYTLQSTTIDGNVVKAQLVKR